VSTYTRVHCSAELEELRDAATIHAELCVVRAEGEAFAGPFAAGFIAVDTSRLETNCVASLREEFVAWSEDVVGNRPHPHEGLDSFKMPVEFAGGKTTQSVFAFIPVEGKLRKAHADGAIPNGTTA
jgi:hypothetical protein